MPPIVIRTCYDGDEFGEKIFFKSSMKNKTKPETTNEERIRSNIKKSQDKEHNAHGLLGKDRYIDEDAMKDLTEDEVKVLNQ